MTKTHKELKREYKEAKQKMGVFQIRNQENNRILIDSSLDIKSKCNRHKMELKLGSHKNKELQKEWKLFGEDKFVFEVLSELKHKEEEANYKEELKILKELFFEKLEPYNEKGYNKQSFL